MDIKSLIDIESSADVENSIKVESFTEGKSLAEIKHYFISLYILVQGFKLQPGLVKS
jgi:hypothetical protein